LDLVYTPTTVSQYTLEYIEQLKQGRRGIPLGIPRFDEYFVPPGPGDLVVVLGRPGMGKSSLMAHWANEASKLTIELGPETGYPIVVTAEMAIEDYSLREVSRASEISTREMKKNSLDDGGWANVEKAVKDMPGTRPIVYIGHSILNKRSRPPMTIENVRRGLEFLKSEYGVAPSMILIDYLQRMKLDQTTRDRRVDMSEIVERSKDLALEFETPVILGAQVGRAVDERTPPIPNLSDGKETGNIEETPDAVLCVFKASNAYPVGETIPKTNPGLVCTPNLFLIGVLKQRGGESGRFFWTSFDMAISRLADIEMERHGFNGEEPHRV
jgi:replicative DNA helicase